MKRDPQYPVTLCPDGTIQCSPDYEPLIRALFLNPRGRRVAISTAGPLTAGPSDGICHGLKRMPVERTRRDGVVTGQVYLRGGQHRGEVRSGALWDGTAVSWIWSVLPAAGTIVLPCPLDREAWNASGRAVGAPLETFAFQAGLADLSVARRVQEALVTRGRWDFPHTIEPSVWTLPQGFRAFVAPYPVWDRGAYLAAGLDGSVEDWRGLLGWRGPGSLMAATELREVVLRGRGVVTPGLVAFPEWEV